MQMVVPEEIQHLDHTVQVMAVVMVKAQMFLMPREVVAVQVVVEM